MYATLPAEIRETHPFHMYDEMKLQPEAVARSLQLVEQTGDPARRALAGARRVLVTGCGTSFHAAQVGALMLRAFSRGAIDAWAVQAYELLTYMPGLRPDDVVVAVSHSGSTTMTVRALEHARAQGADTVLVTGFPESPGGAVAGQVLPTGYPDERSWAHTASYLAAVATLAGLSNQLADPAEQVDLAGLPGMVREALELEEMAHRIAGSTLLAERYNPSTRIMLVGAGANQITAREGVLKLLETSYGDAEAFELEEMLHGPLAAVTPDTLFFVLAPAGSSIERASELVRAVRRIGAVPIVLTAADAAEHFDDTHRLILPAVPEALSPIPYVVPLQLFAYFLAVGSGFNPDLLHRDDARYREARAQYQ